MLSVNDRVKIGELKDDLEDFVVDYGSNIASIIVGTEGTITRLYVYGKDEEHPIYVKLDYNDMEFCFSEEEVIKLG